MATIPTGPTSASVTTIVTPKPASAAPSGSSVLWVAYRLRASRWPTASNGTARAKAASTVAVSRTSSASNAPPPSSTSMASGPTMIRPIAARIDTTAIVAALFRTWRLNPARSPAAHEAESVGKTASEIATPISATGTLWKFRAKLTAVTLPTTSVLATRVKNRNVSGSIGWLIILGTIRRRNSCRDFIRRSSRNLTRTVVRRMPIRRIPRWRNEPSTAPTAAAAIPRRSWRSTVPRTIPTL